MWRAKPAQPDSACSELPQDIPPSPAVFDKTKKKKNLAEKSFPNLDWPGRSLVIHQREKCQCAQVQPLILQCEIYLMATEKWAQG